MLYKYENMETTKKIIKTNIMIKVTKLLSCVKISTIFITLIWLILIIRYFQIRPQFKNRTTQEQQTSSKTQSLIYMKKINELIKMETTYNTININKEFEHFELLMLSMNVPICEAKPILIVSVNYKQVSDSYFTFFQQLQEPPANCYPSVYVLKRKNYLLMNSPSLIQQYVDQILQILEFFASYHQHQLSLLTFEEGSVMLLRALTQCSYKTLSHISKVVFINMFNPNMKILYEAPYKYIHSLLHNLLADPKRLQLFNQLRIVEITTIKQRNPEEYPLSDDKYFTIMLEQQQLLNSVKLSTRYIRNVYCLMHEKDYFLYGEFAAILARFFLTDSQRTLTTQQISYYFYYGQELYGEVKNIYHPAPLSCMVYMLNYENSLEVYDSCTRVELFALKGLEDSGKALLIYGTKITVYNEGLEKIGAFDSSTNVTFYLFERIGETQQLIVLNDEEQVVKIQLINVYSPHLNPFLKPHQQSISSLLQMKATEKYSLITTCPSGNKLLYPLHIDQKGIMHQSVFLTEQTDTQCYIDANQLDIVSQNFILNWDIERNIVIFTLICSYVNRSKTFQRFFTQLFVNVTISYLTISESLFAVNLLLLTLVIVVEKMMDLGLFLSYYLHQHLLVKYQKVMLYCTLVVTLLKNLFEKQLVDISSWKIFLLSLIFLINPYNIIILVIKIYFLGENIIYNHNDVWQMVSVLLWIYNSIDCNDECNGFTGGDRPGWLQTVLTGAISTLLGGPTMYINIVLNIYIYLKFVQKTFT